MEVNSDSAFWGFHHEEVDGGLQVPCRNLREGGEETKHRKSRGFKTRKEAAEDRDRRLVCDGKVIGQLTQLQCSRFQ